MRHKQGTLNQTRSRHTILGGQKGSGVTGTGLRSDAIIRLGGVLNVGVRYEILLGRKVDACHTMFEQGLEPELDAGWHAQWKRRAPKLEK